MGNGWFSSENIFVPSVNLVSETLIRRLGQSIPAKKRTHKIVNFSVHIITYWLEPH